VNSSNEDVKAFLFRRIVGYLEEAYKDFLHLQAVLDEKEMEEMNYWDRANRIHSVKKEMKDFVKEKYPNAWKFF